MRYTIRPRAKYKIATFYQHVIRKYRHTYTVELMHKNIDTALDAMFLIERSLLRRRPTISRWEQQGWHMAHEGKWYYAYTINEDTIIIEDACHEQNMK